MAASVGSDLRFACKYCHSLYLVRKAASIRFELVQAWYKLVIGLDSICKDALVRSNLLQIVDLS
jgi:hypothetical protein